MDNKLRLAIAQYLAGEGAESRQLFLKEAALVATDPGRFLVPFEPGRLGPADRAIYDRWVEVMGSEWINEQLGSFLDTARLTLIKSGGDVEATRDYMLGFVHDYQVEGKLRGADLLPHHEIVAMVRVAIDQAVAETAPDSSD
jgi:hypothetical protein